MVDSRVGDQPEPGEWADTAEGACQVMETRRAPPSVSMIVPVMFVFVAASTTTSPMSSAAAMGLTGSAWAAWVTRPTYSSTATRADLYVSVSDEGSYAADLRAFLTDSFALRRNPQVVDVLCALMAQAQINAEFGERFRASFLQHRRGFSFATRIEQNDQGDARKVPSGKRSVP